MASQARPAAWGCLRGDGEQCGERVGVPVGPHQRPADVQPGGDAQVRVRCQRQHRAASSRTQSACPAGRASSAAASSRRALSRLVGAELGGAFQGACGGGRAAAALRLGRAVFEQRGHVLVGFQRRRGQVPGVAVGLVAERVRDLQVRRGPLGEGRGVVDRRADERMGELRSRRVHPDQARCFRRGERAGGKPGYRRGGQSGLSATAASSSAARAARGGRRTGRP